MNTKQIEALAWIDSSPFRGTDGQKVQFRVVKRMSWTPKYFGPSVLTLRALERQGLVSCTVHHFGVRQEYWTLTQAGAAALFAHRNPV